MTKSSSSLPHHEATPAQHDRSLLRLIAGDANLSDPRSDAALESALLDFDDLEFDDMDVIAEIVPLPPSISHTTRVSLDRAFLLRFTDLYELHEWLHASNHALRGATPYERLMDGDGLDVLRAALRPHGRRRGKRRTATGANSAPSPIRLVP
jgi:hypothetical protein